jgi:hypothetical protein
MHKRIGVVRLKAIYGCSNKGIIFLFWLDAGLIFIHNYMYIIHSEFSNLGLPVTICIFDSRAASLLFKGRVIY